MSEPKPILDYSSPRLESTHEPSAEDARTRAVERYNEATFGEARPIAFALRRYAIFVAVIIGVGVILPRGVSRPVVWFAVGLFFLWELKSDDWRLGRSIRRRWEW